MRGSVLIAVVLITACGRMERETHGLAGADVGGAGATAGGGNSPITIGGSAGDADADTFSSSGDCDFGELFCPDGEYFVDVTDQGERVRLAFPASAGCGDCSGNACVLFGVVVGGCHSPLLTFEACFGDDGAPPCLELGDSAGQYTDAQVRVFDVTHVEQLDFPTTNGEQGVIAMSLALTLVDPSGVARTLDAEIRLCGSLIETPVPC